MNSNLVTYTNISKKSNARVQKITKITIHHYAQVVSTKIGTDSLVNNARDVSSNYIIGNEGGVGLMIPEDRRAWTSSSEWNDQRAITIEVSNSKKAPTWEISDAAMKTLIALCVDICKRNGIAKLYYDGTTSASLTLHEMYAKTNCPGPYIKKNLQYIQDAVNKQLGHNTNPPVKPPVTPPVKPGGNKPTSYQKPSGTRTEINGGGRFVATETIYMRQFIPDHVNGVENGILQPGDYVDYTDVWVGNGHVWIGNGTTWIPTGEVSGGVRKGPVWGRFEAYGGNKPAPKPTKEYIQLDKSRTSWAVYPLGVPLVAKNAKGNLNPNKFGGLEYEVLGRPYANAITIQTGDFGKVNIYVGPDVTQWYKIIRK